MRYGLGYYCEEYIEIIYAVEGVDHTARRFTTSGAGCV